MTVNQRILNYIDEKGIKSVDLAKKLDMSKQNLSRILNADDMKVSQLLSISKILEVSPTTFLSDESTISPEEMSELEQLREALKRNKQHEDLASKYITSVIESHYNLKIEIYNREIKDETKEGLKQNLISRAEKDKIKFKEEYKDFNTIATQLVESLFPNKPEVLTKKIKTEVRKLSRTPDQRQEILDRKKSIDEAKRLKISPDIIKKYSK